MPVQIHGKSYRTVAERVNDFRSLHADWTIQSTLVSADERIVVMKSEIYNDKGRLISTGFAEENRTSSQINRTSALENCETSAVGRALAFFGLAGSEIASANEVEGAISQQNKPQEPPTDVSERVQKLKACKDLKELIKAWTEIYPTVTGDSRAIVILSAVKDQLKGELK